jgi:hypothetical protein
MECGNGRATMVELDMVQVSYFGGFLSKGSRVSFEQYMLFMLFAAKKCLQANAKPGRPGRLETLIVRDDILNSMIACNV